MRYLLALLFWITILGEASGAERLSLNVRTISPIEDPIEIVLRGSSLCAPAHVGASIDYISPLRGDVYIYVVIEYPANCKRDELQYWVYEESIETEKVGRYTIGVYEIDTESFFEVGMAPTVEKTVLVVKESIFLWIPIIESTSN